MSRPLTIRKPNADELHQLHQWLEQPLQSWQRRRAEVLLLYAADGSVSSIAQLLQVHRNTVSTDLREFAARPVGAEPTAQARSPAALVKEANRCHLAPGRPSATTLGLPLGRWSLAKLRAYLIRQRIVPTISREHLRRVLKKGDTHFAASVASSSAPIPIGI